MFTSGLTLVALGLAGTAVASMSYDRDTGKLSSVDSFSKHELDSEITLKEICYRNLYADVDYFKVKNAQELLLSDTKGGQVFLSDGLKKDYQDKEYYYEEFCYKQYKAREHSNDVEKANGIIVSKRDFASTLGLGGLSGFSGSGGGFPDVFGGNNDGAKDGGKGDQGNKDVSKVGGASGLFSPGSFLDSFSRGNGLGDMGFGDNHGVDGGDGKKEDNSGKGDGHKDDGSKGSFGAGAGFGDSLNVHGPAFDGAKADGHDGAAKGQVGDTPKKDDSGVKKRGFAMWFRRVVVARD